jgi:hypothetical protein
MQLSTHVVEDDGHASIHAPRLVPAALLLHATASSQQQLARHVPHALVAMDEHWESTPPHWSPTQVFEVHVKPVSHVLFGRHGQPLEPCEQSGTHPETAPIANAVPRSANARNPQANTLHFVHIFIRA